MDGDKQPIPILLFAESILGIRPYDWQCQILLHYEAGNQTAAACANFTGKTSTVFPIAALWTLYSFPRARLMYLSATSSQVRNQFIASLERFRNRPGLAGWTWLETEIRNPHGGFLFGRATDTSGNIEGLHDQPDSPAAILVDEAKSIRDEVLDALERCHTTFRLFMSSTGAAFGGFYQICTAKPNHTVYDDLESRRFTAVKFEPPNRRSSLLTRDAPQDTYDRNLVPKPDLTR
jgi:hypothetical protein